ncbi:MAG: hypothetical protein KAK00_01545 [Nanoarchaeota archaeon]|nr:hypothetical protein [Nanoarchaeota archaeon]
MANKKAEFSLKRELIWWILIIIYYFGSMLIYIYTKELHGPLIMWLGWSAFMLLLFLLVTAKLNINNKLKPYKQKGKKDILSNIIIFVTGGLFGVLIFILFMVLQTRGLEPIIPVDFFTLFIFLNMSFIYPIIVVNMIFLYVAVVAILPCSFFLYGAIYHLIFNKVKLIFLEKAINNKSLNLYVVVSMILLTLLISTYLLMYVNFKLPIMF